MISPTVLSIPHSTQDNPHGTHDIPPRYSRYPPTVLKISSHGTQNIPHGTQDIPHGTEHPPRYCTHIVQGEKGKIYNVYDPVRRWELLVLIIFSQTRENSLQEHRIYQNFGLSRQRQETKVKQVIFLGLFFTFRRSKNTGLVYLATSQSEVSEISSNC